MSDLKFTVTFFRYFPRRLSDADREGFRSTGPRGVRVLHMIYKVVRDSDDIM
jgi:hypothetical protein